MSRALCIIDPQTGFDHESVTAIFPGILELAKDFDGQVYIMQFINQPDSNFIKQLSWDRMMEGDETDLIAGFDELNATVIKHSTYNCMTPEVEKFLKAGGIDTIYFCGVFTDICILMTAMESFDRGYRTFVIKDLIHTLHGEAVHNACMYSIDSAIGRKYLINSQQAADAEKLEERLEN